MARKKSELTSELIKEEGTGTLSQNNEENSSCHNSEEEEKSRQKRKGRPKHKEAEPFKRTLENILSMIVSPTTVAKEVLSTPLGDKITYQEAILLAQVIKASLGNTQAAVFLRDTSGNKLKETKDTGGENKSFEEF